MAQLILVRHGQASFGTENYDKLSELGQLQARAVGRALLSAGTRPSLAYSGLMTRQQHTADLALSTAGSDLSVDASKAFDEYDSESVFSTYLPGVLDDFPEIKARITPDNYAALKEPEVFRTVFYPVMYKWISGEDPASGIVESWAQFRERVLDGVQRVTTALPVGETAVIFTSGGVISVILAHVLGLEASASVDYNWRTANGSITSLTLSEQGLALQVYNHHEHLDDPAAGLRVTFL